MCWETSKTRYKQPHVATRDINVTKVVRNVDDVIKPLYYHGVVYHINKQYSTNITPEIQDDILKIRKGFHSYKKTNKYLFYAKQHMHTIMNCVIPKGTKYYLNEKGEYVSESLIPVSIEE